MSSGKTCLIFGVQRGGSSLFGSAIIKIASAYGMVFHDIAKQVYDAGHSLENFDVRTLNFSPENIYGVFRSMPKGLEELVSRTRRIFLLRDPRDCLVSHYFATASLHSRVKSVDSPNKPLYEFEPHYPKIDEHCLLYARYYRMRFEAFVDHFYKYSDSIVYRYEDVFAEPSAWIFDLSRLISPDSQVLESIERYAHGLTLSKAKEEPSAHHRIGIPGDYLRRLHPEIVEELTWHFQKILSFYYSDFCRRFSTNQSVSRVPNLSQQDYINAKLDELSIENGYRIEEIKLLRSELGKA
jgi:hypothetical protein